MKRKHIISRVLMFTFLLTILSVGLIVDKAHAEGTAANYKAHKTLDYLAEDAQMYDDYTIVFGREGYGLVDNSGNTTFRNYHEDYSNFMGRLGNNLYFYGYENNAVELVDISSGTTTAIKQVGYSGLVTNGIIDSQGNQWFVIAEDNQFYILRVGANGTDAAVQASTDAFKLEVDSNNNLWFIDAMDRTNLFKVSYANDNLTLKKYSMGFKGWELKLDSKGQAFVSNYDKGIFQVKETTTGIELISKSENLNKDSERIMDFDIDKNNNIWATVWRYYGDNQAICKVEANKLVEKHTFSKELNFAQLSIINDNKMFVVAPKQPTYNGAHYIHINEAVANKGWVKDSNGKWKYYDPQTGVMKKGWLSDAGIWYYLDQNGEMKTGWSNVGGKWYFHDSKGAMKTGWLSNAGKWYFLASSGEMKTGWLSNGGKWYFLAGSGEMKTGWVQVGTKWYYFYSDGSMASNTTIGGYKLGNDGAWIQ